MFETIKNPAAEFEQKVQETSVLVDNLFKKYNLRAPGFSEVESLRVIKSDKREELEFARKGEGEKYVFKKFMNEDQEMASKILKNLIAISEIGNKGRRLPPTKIGDYIAGEYNGALRGHDGKINMIGQTRQFCITDDPEVAKREILEPLHRMMELYKEDIEKFAQEKQK